MNKYAAKKKKRLAKLYAPLGSPLFFCSESFPLLSSHFMPAFVPTLMPAPIPTLIFHLRSPAILSSCYVFAFISYLGSPNILLFCYLPAPISCLRSLAILLSCYVPALAAFVAFFLPYHIFVFCCKIPAFLSSFFMLGLSLLLGSSSLRIFKKILSDRF